MLVHRSKTSYLALAPNDFCDVGIGSPGYQRLCQCDNVGSGRPVLGVVDVQRSTVTDAGVLGRKQRVSHQQGSLNLDDVPVPLRRVVFHHHGEFAVAGHERALFEG